MSGNLSPLHELGRLGQSVWIDNISRELIASGDLGKLIDLGVTGLTSNPSIFEKAVSGSTDYDESMLRFVNDGMDTEQVFEALAIEDIRSAADLLMPIYDRTDGADGYASLEVNPHLAADTDGTVSEGLRIFETLSRPNIMIKVPATPEGMPAIASLLEAGVNVNATLIFSLDAYNLVSDAYIDGLEARRRAGGGVNRVASVASFFVSRVDSAVDGLIDGRVGEGRADLANLKGKAAIANAKLAYQAFKGTFGGDRFTELRSAGAMVQRPLWASTSTKDPSYSDVMYIESLIGRDTVNTLPDATLDAFVDHGAASETLDRDADAARDAVESLEAAGISMDAVTSKLLADGVKAFANAYDQLVANIDVKRQRLIAAD
jgi:transaldolase